MSITFNVKITDICFHILKIKNCAILQIYVTLATKPSYRLEFTETIIFKTDFLLTEKQMCIYKRCLQKLNDQHLFNKK